MTPFNAIAFPWLFFSEEGAFIERGPGSLFGLPPQCDSADNRSFYAALTRDGWHTCPQGFAVYRHSVEKPSLGFLVLPGLRVTPYCKFRGRSDWLSITTNLVVVERHVLSVLHSIGSVHDEFDRITRQNIHEIRGLNGGVYHDGHELADLIKNGEGGIKRAQELSLNIVAMSKILSARLDYITYISNQSLTYSDIESIPVYRRFDKMIRCFMSRAAKRGISFALSGESNRCVSGPKNLFELVPYLIIDNAVKYSPDNNRISVTFLENSERVTISVLSVGPQITDDEASAIFIQSFRGRYAQQSGKDGTGIGLSVLKNLVENMYFGTIGLRRGGRSTSISGIPYDYVTFFIEFPLDSTL